MINKNFFIFTSALAFWDGDDVGHVLEIGTFNLITVFQIPKT